MTKDSEFEAFDETMDKLLQVPYSELKKKLDEEKKVKAKAKKKRARSTSSGRVSSKDS